MPGLTPAISRSVSFTRVAADTSIWVPTYMCNAATAFRHEIPAMARTYATAKHLDHPAPVFRHTESLVPFKAGFNATLGVSRGFYPAHNSALKVASVARQIGRQARRGLLCPDKFLWTQLPAGALCHLSPSLVAGPSRAHCYNGQSVKVNFGHGRRARYRSSALAHEHRLHEYLLWARSLPARTRLLKAQ